MQPDELEQKLSRQPLRPVPPEWRGDILAAANAGARPAANAARPGFLSTLNEQLATVFWPHPKAWAGLAAVWVLILAVDFSLRDNSPRIAEKSAPPSPEVIVELKKQRQLFAELAGAREPQDADRQKVLLPRPRSERVDFLMT